MMVNYLIDALRAGSSGAGERVFATLPDRTTMSFDHLFGGAEQMAAALFAAGVTPGDRVAVQVEKSPSAVQLYLGTVMAGAIFLPLNTAYTPAELDYFLTDAAPRVFVCDPARIDALAPIATKAGTARILTLGSDGSGTLAEAAQTRAARFAAVARSASDIAAILYTSGTTGRSKGAMLTHDNLASNARVLASLWKFTPQDVLIHALPIFHTHGLFVATNVALVAGASLRFHASFDAAAILADMADATVLMGVPTFYTRLLAHPDLNRQTTAGMRVFVSGSAPLLAQTHMEWSERTGHAILERYGMTETNMNSSNPYNGERRPGTVGFALPGTEIIITDPATGAPLPQGDVGAIEVRGPNVFKGYWQMPEKTAAELRENGFFITGDLGRFSSDGYLEIVGRSKDLIITGGYNVYPKELEDLIDALPGVAESAVFGLPHPDFGESVAVAVVLRPDSTMTATEIQQAISSNLARFKQPKQVFILAELPRNAMGKVSKAVLRQNHIPVPE